MNRQPQIDARTAKWSPELTMDDWAAISKWTAAIRVRTVDGQGFHQIGHAPGGLFRWHRKRNTCLAAAEKQAARLQARGYDAFQVVLIGLNPHDDCLYVTGTIAV